MCGMCGIVSIVERKIEKNKISKMLTAINHRGPDDNGVYTDNGIALGQCRLSIIDLSDAAHQPMVSKCGRYVLTYNGELYNFREIRAELEKIGFSFRSHSDTEVVLNACIYWKDKAFKKFNGMYAIAFWDNEEAVLYLARDRFGIKPLYYYKDDDVLIFGSELKALLAAEKIDRRMDFQGLGEYLWYGNALCSNTLFNGVKRLLPGHYLKFGRDKYEINSFWRIEETEQRDVTFKEAALVVREKLEDAVKRHLISDVPVGVFLSGGIDSSSICAFASKHYPDKLNTYTASFDFNKGVNELAQARFVAERFNTNHHELHITGKELPNAIESLVCAHDEPFGDAANIPLYLLCKELRGNLKVILQGDGGDEIFAGYRRYNALICEKNWQILSKVALGIQGLMPCKRPFYYRLKRIFQRMAQNDPAIRMALFWTSELAEDLHIGVFSFDFQKTLAEYDPFYAYRKCFKKFEKFDSVQRMLYTDCSLLLPNTFLEKVDRATMANSIEVRVPFLDADLTEYVLGLPSSFKIKYGKTKKILRQSLRGIIPDSILDMPKTGFGVPVAYWLRSSLADYLQSVLLDSSVESVGIFNKAKLNSLIDQHLKQKKDNGVLLWKLLNFVLWRKEYNISF